MNHAVPCDLAPCSHLRLRLRWNIKVRTIYRLLYWIFGFCANAGWSTLIESDPQPVIYFSGYNILLLSWSRWRHNASGFKRSNGLPGARLAERLTWQPINHSAKHASPHHRRRMWLYSMKKHICAPTHMRIVSKSKTRFSTCIALGIVVLELTPILS